MATDAARTNHRPRTASATSLDPPELFLQFVPFPLATGPLRQPHNLDRLLGDEFGTAVAFRHTGWRNQRRRILQVMAEQGYSLERLNRFCRCGSHAYVMCRADNPTIVRVAGSACRDRWCQPCARDRARTIAANLIEHTAGCTLRFVTLTLRHNENSLSQQLDRLYACFVALRRCKFWSKCVQGGCSMIEVTRNAATGTWHPHMHLILQGSYMPHAQLRHHWLKITGDSSIVDVRAVRDQQEVYRYVAKYVTKPWKGEHVRDTAVLNETMRALDGKRLCNTFGSWRSLRLTESPVSDAWVTLGSLDEILRRARRNDEAAKLILSRLDRTAVDAAMAQLPAEPPQDLPPPESLEWHRQYDLFDNYNLNGWHHS